MTRAASGIANFNTLLENDAAKAPLGRTVTIDEVGALTAFLCVRFIGHDRADDLRRRRCSYRCLRPDRSDCCGQPEKGLNFKLVGGKSANLKRFRRTRCLKLTDYSPTPCRITPLTRPQGNRSR
jgi:hypothetical protein